MANSKDRSRVTISLYATRYTLLAIRYSPFAIRCSLLCQQIPYLLEQHLLARRRRGFRFLAQAQPVHALDGEEDHPGNEEKIDAHGDEIAPGEHRALLLGRS